MSICFYWRAKKKGKEEKKKEEWRINFNKNKIDREIEDNKKKIETIIISYVGRVHSTGNVSRAGIASHVCEYVSVVSST